jgi:hypothetical protein
MSAERSANWRKAMKPKTQTREAYLAEHFDGFADGETAGDARLGGRQVKQGLHQFDRGCLRQGHGGQEERGSRADKRMGMTCATIIASAPVSRTGKERTAEPPATSIAVIASRNKLSAPPSFSDTRSCAPQ